MRITRLEHTPHCDMWSCQRNYCREDRLIYQSCNTEISEDSRHYDDGPRRRIVYYTDECPECSTRERSKRYAAIQGESNEFKAA